jgi:hypothetical protein
LTAQPDLPAFANGERLADLGVQWHGALRRLEPR